MDIAITVLIVAAAIFCAVRIFLKQAKRKTGCGCKGECGNCEPKHKL